MARHEYQASMDALRQDVLYMGDLVTEHLQYGLDSLREKNPELANSVIIADNEINEMYLDLEQAFIDLIALQQPVASDLRFVVASFKILTDLERIGDLAVNLAQYALAAERDLFPEVDIQKIGSVTVEMLADALRAYERELPELCHAIAARDDELDEMCELASTIVVRDLMEAQGDEVAPETGPTMQDISRMLLTIRDLERVGDHGVNIAARSLYMVEDDDELLF
jgi:phosphate uptake regulator, PhoU